MSTKVIRECRCDKCGKLLEYNERGRIWLKKYGALSVMFPSWCCETEYDICGDCYKKLKNWFGEKVIEND